MGSLSDARTDGRTRRLWVGGAPCSGKSTIVSALCQDHALEAYHCDDHWDRHVAQATPAAQPRMCALRTMSWDDIWMRDVTVQVKDELALYREQFPMILSDIESVADSETVLAEGAALLPESVATQIRDRHQAIWVVPTEAFQRRIYRSRGPWVEQILAQCSDPETAWDHWMARDAAFAHTVAEQARALWLEVLWVDGQETVEQVRVRVEAWFAPLLGA